MLEKKKYNKLTPIKIAYKKRPGQLLAVPMRLWKYYNRERSKHKERAHKVLRMPANRKNEI